MNSYLTTSMVIKNISSKLAKSLGKTKKELLNEKVKNLIPSYYAPIHTDILKSWINSVDLNQNSLALAEGHEEIPLKINKRTIIFMRFEFRILLDSLTG